MGDKSYEILVIDDEPQNIENIFQVLHKNNYGVLVATEGYQGIGIAQTARPDLILIDWDMPGIDGIETIKLAKKDPQINQIPVIMATGKMTTSENLQTALDAGATDYVRKPIDKIELIARVRSAIMLHEEMKKTIRLEKTIMEQKQKELENQLAQNKRELNNAIIRLLHSSQFRLQLWKKLSELSENLSDKGKKGLSAIQNYVKTHSNAANWDEFEIIFKKVHSRFFSNLHRAHPDLTPNERRLCVFLKLNMSGKDISAITFQSLTALKKARFRIRKKMNLKQGENLSTYLQQF
jgi:DNA-binding response OmpR family regulator